MPTEQYNLTWMEDSNRWRKKYKKQTHYFPLKPGETKKSSYRRCYRAWLKKKQELDNRQSESPLGKQYKRAIAQWQFHRDFFAKQDDDLSKQGYERAEQMIQSLQARLDTDKSLPELKRYESDPLWGVPEAGKIVWAERRRSQSKASNSDSPTIGNRIADLLERKKAQATGEQRSYARYDALRCHLTAFEQWIGADQPIANLNYALLEKYHSHLIHLIGSKSKSLKISRYTARDRMQAVKQLARVCMRKNLIAPLLLDDDEELGFRLTSRKIKTVDDQTIQLLLQHASERTRLYLLLMLNTGMQQKDISDLRHDEVDWNKGRIIRKRSKTQHAGEQVPVVDYLLFAQTFELLKRHRSDDPVRVLVNEKGQPLKSEQIREDGKLIKRDNIKSAFDRLVSKLAKQTVTDKAAISAITLKLFRKTSSSKLAEHATYGRFSQFFLGQAPTSVADKHYVQPPQKLFDRAIRWLERQYRVL